MPSIYRRSLPLASLTAVGMLATDFYLPAVPMLSAQLGGSTTAAQATLAVFMAALAASQLLWGWASDRFGEGRVILLGTALLGGASVLCAIAPNIAVLLLGRAIQGLGAGAATVVVPALLRKRSSEADAVKAIALVGMAESVIPALGPVAGALVLTHGSWRWTFLILALLTLALAPMISRIVQSDAESGNADTDRNMRAGAALSLSAAVLSYRPVLGNARFVRLALSYALMFGALLMFVASAPQLVTAWLGIPVAGFAVLQIFGVAAFMLGAAGGGKLVRRLGADVLIKLGIWTQAGACLIFLALAATELRSLSALIGAWAVFCVGLGIRAPSTMARALSLAGEAAGRASGLLMFLAFAISALATMLVAPLLGGGLMPVAIGLILMVAASAAVLRAEAGALD
jgi:MFS transporter, DHA1 family, multidrug resistance protein